MSSPANLPCICIGDDVARSELFDRLGHGAFFAPAAWAPPPTRSHPTNARRDVDLVIALDVSGLDWRVLIESATKKGGQNKVAAGPLLGHHELELARGAPVPARRVAILSLRRAEAMASKRATFRGRPAVHGRSRRQSTRTSVRVSGPTAARGRHNVRACDPSVARFKLAVEPDDATRLAKSCSSPARESAEQDPLPARLQRGDRFGRSRSGQIVVNAFSAAQSDKRSPWRRRCSGWQRVATARTAATRICIDQNAAAGRDRRDAVRRGLTALKRLTPTATYIAIGAAASSGRANQSRAGPATPRR
jgi:hypothetical protein